MCHLWVILVLIYSNVFGFRMLLSKSFINRTGLIFFPIKINFDGISSFSDHELRSSTLGLYLTDLRSILLGLFLILIIALNRF